MGWFLRGPSYCTGLYRLPRPPGVLGFCRDCDFHSHWLYNSTPIRHLIRHPSHRTGVLVTGPGDIRAVSLARPLDPLFTPRSQHGEFRAYTLFSVVVRSCVWVRWWVEMVVRFVCVIQHDPCARLVRARAGARAPRVCPVCVPAPPVSFYRVYPVCVPAPPGVCLPVCVPAPPVSFYRYSTVPVYRYRRDVHAMHVRARWRAV